MSKMNPIQINPHKVLRLILHVHSAPFLPFFTHLSKTYPSEFVTEQLSRVSENPIYPLNLNASLPSEHFPLYLSTFSRIAEDTRPFDVVFDQLRTKSENKIRRGRLRLTVSPNRGLHHSEPLDGVQVLRDQCAETFEGLEGIGTKIGAGIWRFRPGMFVLQKAEGGWENWRKRAREIVAEVAVEVGGETERGKAKGVLKPLVVTQAVGLRLTPTWLDSIPEWEGDVTWKFNADAPEREFSGWSMWNRKERVRVFR